MKDGNARVSMQLDLLALLHAVVPRLHLCLQVVAMPLLLLVPWKPWLPLIEGHTRLANYQKLTWLNACPQPLMAVTPVDPVMDVMEEIQP